ncbi:hypothetical protein DSO57_1016281 [Entomophthora muscae]|uniref:Uncharacterized protein n=1 Tax=Entomophthora muscae TaxID=34485 RepID=A0ACC2T514_9FUNG|nr:hypothetical protein DSO57_1016281 [Entomophthora muscae]
MQEPGGHKKMLHCAAFLYHEKPYTVHVHHGSHGASPVSVSFGTQIFDPYIIWVANKSATVMNDISILVLKIWELKPRSQGKPYVDQSGQETTQLPVGSNPGPPEIDDPKQGEQKPANLSSVNTGGLKSTLETLELNPDPPKST